ncbi:hypothetical protein Aab01nite_06380 [Paractinoplanes abujensis]|nr:hypothetical protein Aab01nite_06380 [Actinoplanes abujensis]
MRSRNIDQLPVTTAAGLVIGVFSHRSLALGMHHVASGNPLIAPVDDLVEDLRFVLPSEQVEKVLDSLAADNAVLVGDEEQLLAIVTAADLNNFLWWRTQPFLLLRDIELGVRDLMRSSCSPEELSACITVSLPSGSGIAEALLENLTWSQLLTVLLQDSNFGRHFRHQFGKNRGIVKVTLDPVREIRNKVFHFRAEISLEELQSLKDVTAWLRRRTIMNGGGR